MSHERIEQLLPLLAFLICFGAIATIFLVF